MLREKLQQIIEVEDVELHPVLLAAIGTSLPNSIQLKSSPYPIERYTCLVHTLGFTERPGYLAIANYGLGRVFAGKSFADWLLARGLLIEIAQSSAREGDLVFYFDAGGFTHAGVWLGENQVLSKWGTGHLFQHALFELPSSYANGVRFFKQTPYEEVFGHFLRFARENGSRVRSAE